MRQYEILDSAYHSNGNAVPFVVAIVDDADENDVKLVIMFEDEDYTAVLSLDRLEEDEDISERTNGWNGRRYEVLRDDLWSDSE
jgi:hypothetical protein